MPKKGENIYKRKDGRWEGRYIRGYHADGKAKYAYVYGKTYADVKQKLIDDRIAFAQGKDTTRCKTKYRDILHDWLAMSRMRIKESTYSRYVDDSLLLPFCQLSIGEDVLKTKSSFRTLPLIPAVEKLLLEEKEKQEMFRRLFKKSYCRDYLDYICVDQTGKLLRPNYVTEHFAWLIQKYDLKKIRFHDLRHTFASLLINQDVPLINVSNFLGHSDLSTTANIYAHLDKASKQASAAVISGILQGENRHAQPEGEPETNTDRQT